MFRHAEMSTHMLVAIFISLIVLAVVLFYMGVQAGVLDKFMESIKDAMRWSP